METETLATSQEAQAAEAKNEGASQKDTVYALALAALGEAKPAEGQPLKSLITKEVRKQIRVKLYEGIENGTIGYARSGKTDGELKKYCSSLINNWLKKDARFN